MHIQGTQPSKQGNLHQEPQELSNLTSFLRSMAELDHFLKYFSTTKVKPYCQSDL